MEFRNLTTGSKIYNYGRKERELKTYKVGAINTMTNSVFLQNINDDDDYGNFTASLIFNYFHGSIAELVKNELAQSNKKIQRESKHIMALKAIGNQAND